jgi:hypothetical protein
MFGFPRLEVTPLMGHSAPAPVVPWRRPLLAVIGGLGLGVPARTSTSGAVARLGLLMVALDAARRNRDEVVAQQDQLTALSLFWHITLNARTMTRLAQDR